MARTWTVSASSSRSRRHSRSKSSQISRSTGRSDGRVSTGGGGGAVGGRRSHAGGRTHVDGRSKSPNASDASAALVAGDMHHPPARRTKAAVPPSPRTPAVMPTHGHSPPNSVSIATGRCGLRAETRTGPVGLVHDLDEGQCCIAQLLEGGSVVELGPVLSIEVLGSP